ncbi:hypothetical protein [Flammeovirga sp. SubArs3]|uniref:hypothetical protein n=1 Tax=Flammeovirga sp. SubArs3 TaxID=2995316 RepID=UPI00248D1DEE|nr:hypothetical protein [Flammeovirga sp. SubArs3]
MEDQKKEKINSLINDGLKEPLPTKSTTSLKHDLNPKLKELKQYSKKAAKPAGNIALGSAAVIGGVLGAEKVSDLLSDDSAQNDNTDEPVESVAQPDYNWQEAPVAQSVNDDMTFSEAFSSAREELGAGGVFYWNGSPYHTFTEEEYDPTTGEVTVDVEEAEVVAIETDDFEENYTEEDAVEEDGNTSDIVYASVDNHDDDPTNDETYTSTDTTEEDFGYENPEDYA